MSTMLVVVYLCVYKLLHSLGRPRCCGPSQFAAHRYLFLNDTLVAPIWDSSQNETSRTVWVPPGSWQDGWDGSIVTGPQTITVTRPYEQIPMWHRRGGLVVTLPAHVADLRVEVHSNTIPMRLRPCMLMSNLKCRCTCLSISKFDLSKTCHTLGRLRIKTGPHWWRTRSPPLTTVAQSHEPCTSAAVACGRLN